MPLIKKVTSFINKLKKGKVQMAKILKDGVVTVGNVPTDELMQRLEAHRKNNPSANWTIEL